MVVFQFVLRCLCT